VPSKDFFSSAKVPLSNSMQKQVESNWTERQREDCLAQRINEKHRQLVLKSASFDMTASRKHLNKCLSRIIVSDRSRFIVAAPSH